MNKAEKKAIQDILSKKFRSWAYRITTDSVKVFPANIKYTQSLLIQDGLSNVKIVADKTIAKPCKKTKN